MERSDLLAKTRAETGCGVGELAKLLSMQQPYVSKPLSLQKLIPKARELVAAGKLDIDKASTLSQLPPEQQEEMLTEVGGMSRDQVRAKAKAKPDKPKAKRAMFALASGISVTVQGCELSLTEAIESLAETLKALKLGLSEGWDITTAQRVMRDKAKVM